MNATFYDHAANSADCARGYAIAKVRREAIEEGQAYYVEANWSGGNRFYWEGGWYDAIGLAKTLVYNRAENVVFRSPKGKEWSEHEIRDARY